jgi:hypothetical protein
LLATLSPLEITVEGKSMPSTQQPILQLRPISISLGILAPLKIIDNTRFMQSPHGSFNPILTQSYFDVESVFIV